MYPTLFGISALNMYDIIGVLGYAFIIGFYLFKKNRGTWWRGALLMLVQLVAYTFAGARMATLLVGRNTEFFGFLTVSALGVALAALSLGENPLHRLDSTVPLYLMLAAVLKFSCFCAGCCNGHPWIYGLYNQRHHQPEFPIQLVEAALYGLLLLALWRYQGRAGQRFWLCVLGYAGVRFAVQFFRADIPVFSPFHWMSLLFFGVGVLGWLVCRFLPVKTEENEEESAGPEC